jgi:hypothetical protein
MRLNFEMAQIERMSEGVVLLDKLAEVKSCNSAARGWLPACIRQTGYLRKLIEDERSGQLTLPAEIRLGEPDSELPNKSLPVLAQIEEAADAWLCKDGRWNYVLFIARPTPVQGFKSSETRIVALLGEQARQEISMLGELLRAANSPGELNRSAILQQSARVDRVLTEINYLATLLQRDEVFLEDRLSLVGLIKEVLPTLPRQRGEHLIHYKLLETLDNFGAIYGDAEWLKYAIKHLLIGLGESAPPHSQVVIELRQLGDFIVFTGRVQNAQQRRPGTPVAHDEGKSSPIERDIRLEMCQRIIQLHGGRIKLSMVSSDGIDACAEGVESFTLNLLTGLPDHDRSRVSCAECRYTKQAQAYAIDIAALLAERAQQAITGVSTHD